MANYPKSTNSVPYSINCSGKLLCFDKPRIMGILNVTDDSFFDGGRYRGTEAALARAEQMLLEGADIIDVGGQSTRPGAVMVTEEEELNRILPVISAIAKQFPETLISIDTFRSGVARRAADAGAVIINDVSAGDDDPLMLQTVAALNLPYIAMHKQGKPETMQNNPQYHNVVHDISEYFKNKIHTCEAAGITDLIIDPGFGFGKTMEQSYALLANLETFQTLKKPLLVGVSRKSMIWKLLETDAAGALNGTTSVHTIALMNGADMLRVHDVKAAAEIVAIVQTLQRSAAALQ